jgi:tetratricopeptide (TPR) repeat protein
MSEMRFILPALSLVLLAVSACELRLSTESVSEGSANRFCRAYLCDDYSVTQAAYKQQLAGTPESLASASAVLSDLLVRDPSSPRRWADFGDALAQADSLDRARASYDQALVLGHSSAAILLDATRFYLRYGDRRKGLQCASRVLATGANSSEAIFSFLAANQVTASEVLDSGLPAEKVPTQSYLRYFISESDIGNARPLWRWIIAQHFADTGITVDYTKFLLAQKHFSEAAETWGSRISQDDPEYLKTEFLFNGDFESELIPNAPFDWNIEPSEHAEIKRDTQLAYSGRYSLRITFDGAANTRPIRIACFHSGKRSYDRSRHLCTRSGCRNAWCDFADRSCSRNHPVEEFENEVHNSGHDPHGRTACHPPAFTAL